MAVLDFALEYIAQGFSVFPVGVDKKPLTAHGLKDATQTQAGVKEFWSKWPEAGIAITTDGLVVLDFDAKSGGKTSKEEIEKKYGVLPKTRVHRTGGGGLHYLYLNPNGRVVRNTVSLGGYAGVDVRGDGGYIVAPPSSHSSGRLYKIVDKSPLALCPEYIIEMARSKAPGQVTTEAPDEVIPEGQRNATLTSLAGTMRRRGMPKDVIEVALLAMNSTRCNPPLPDNDVRVIAASVSRYEPAVQEQTQIRELSQSQIAEWVTLASGNFNVRQIWSELGITSPEGKSHLRVILHRLTDSGVIAKTLTDGVFRKLNNEKKPIHWENANPNSYLPIQLPFGLHEFCKVFPKSIIIVAGSKNEGKTAFLSSCVMPNVESSGLVVDFFNSESGPEQLNERFSSCGVPIPPPFDTYERYDNFADVIEPDHLSIIDYLDLNSEVYLVGTEIDAIFRKLTTGCAIIGLQKPPPSVTLYRGIKKVIDRDLAYGGGFTAKRASIYISLSSHRLKLVYVKTPAKPRVNPNNMMWTYDFDEKGNFANIQRYQPGLYD